MFLIKHFVASNIHLGHKINKWNPRTSNFILGMKDNIFIIDLEQTLIMIKRALTFVKKICLNRGYIFYVPSFFSTQKDSKFRKENDSLKIRTNINNKIKSFPTNLRQGENNLIYISPEFISSSKTRGMLYAFTQKRNNLYTFSSYTNISSNLDKNNSNLDFLNFFFKPEVLFLLDTNKNPALIKESLKLQIPIIGILDSDSNIFGIRYPIPGNDDTLETQKLYTELLLNTIIDAKKKEAKLLLSNK